MQSPNNPDPEPAKPPFKESLLQLKSLTALQSHLTGAPALIATTRNLLAEKITTLSLTARNHSTTSLTRFLPDLASIRAKLQNSNLPVRDLDALIDELLKRLQSRFDNGRLVSDKMVQYERLLEMRNVLARGGVGFGFERLDGVIRCFAEGLCLEADAVNKVLRRDETVDEGLSRGRVVPESAVKKACFEGVGEEVHSSDDELDDDEDEDDDEDMGGSWEPRTSSPVL